MANGESNDLLENLGEVISRRLESAKKEQVAELVDVLFGKTIEKITRKVRPIKQKPEEKKETNQTSSVQPKESTPIKGASVAPPPLPIQEPVAPESKLEKQEKPLLIGGFTEQALKQLQKALPDFLSGTFEGLNNTLKGLTKSLEDLKVKKGLGMGALGFLGLVLGALEIFDSITDSGPYKGLKLLLGKLSIKGAIEAIKIPFKMLSLLKDKFFGKLDTIKKVVPEVAEQIERNADEVVKGFRGKIADKLSKIISPVKNFFAEIGTRIGTFFSTLFEPLKRMFGFLGKEGAESVTEKAVTKAGGSFLAKFLTKESLRRIPIIGSLISIGSAWSRFKTGDLLGGGLDVLSALSGLLYLTPATAPFAFSIGLAIDALNAFLDFKAGGSDVAGGKAKPKGELLIGWLKGLGSWVVKKMKSIPVVGDILEGWDLITAGKTEEGFEKFPIIGDLLRAFKDPYKEFAAGNVVSAGLMLPVKTLVDGISWFLTSITNKVKELLKKAPGWLLPDTVEKWVKEPEAPKTQTPKAENLKTETNKEPQKPVQQTKDALIDPQGGLVVSSPKEGALFQLSKNDGVAAGPWAKNNNAVEVNLDDKFLQDVANNTKDTNESIKQLAAGFFMLAKQLGVVAEKAVDGGGNVISVNGVARSQKPSTADIARQTGTTSITQLRRELSQILPQPV
jgi:hypothetical protein